MAEIRTDGEFYPVPAELEEFRNVHRGREEVFVPSVDESGDGLDLLYEFVTLEDAAPDDESQRKSFIVADNDFPVQGGSGRDLRGVTRR